MMNLRILRKQKGFTCERIGKIVGVDKSTMSKYERGEVQPSQEVLKRLAEVLKTTTDFLLGLTNNPNPSPLPLLKEWLLAFDKEEFQDLSKDELDRLMDYALLIKSQRKNNFTKLKPRLIE